MASRNLHSPNAGGPSADLGSPCEFSFSTPSEREKTPARHSIGDFRSPQLIGEVTNPFRESFFHGLVFTPGVFREGPSSHVRLLSYLFALDVRICLQENSPKEFKWTPEHRAFLNPAIIDDEEAMRQSRSLHEYAHLLHYIYKLFLSET